MKVFSKLMIKTAIYIASILLYTSCQKDIIKDYNLLSFEGQEEFERDIVAEFNSLIESTNYNKAILGVIESILSTNSIRDINLDDDSTAIFWTYEDNVRCCLYLRNEDINSVSAKSIDQSKYINDILSENYQLSKGLPRSSKALIISPFNWQMKNAILNYDETEIIAPKLITAGFTVNYLKNEKKFSNIITLNDYKDLDQYGVIFIKTHGAVDSVVYLSSGVPFTKSIRNEYDNEFNNHTLIKFILKDKEFNTTVGITPNWFRLSFPAPPKNLLFFPSACYGKNNSTLEEVIIGNGSAYLGWNKSVTIEKSYDVAIEIFKGLLDRKLSAYDSWLEAFKNGYCTYNEEGSTATLFFSGEHSFQLIANIPSVSTGEAVDLTTNSATVIGLVTTDGCASITERGIYWGRNNNPEITGTKRQVGSGTGSFSVNLTGLSSNTKYYVKAYAVNSQGINYGQEVSFTTLSESQPGTITDIDGNVYQTVQLGNQTWMAADLKTKRYNNGDQIPNVTSNSSWAGLINGAYCYFNNQSGNFDIYGLLYNQYAVMDSRKICPAGWHVPSDDEWKTMELYLGMSQAQVNLSYTERGTNQGGKLKESGTVHWLSPNTGATNETGFTAVPGGWRGPTDGPFPQPTVTTQGSFWWTSTSGIYRAVHCYNATIWRNSNYSRNAGFSVRCVRD